jgi:thioredoxin 1
MSISEPDSVLAADDDNHQQIVDDGLVLLDFWAEWCGPCTAMEPVIKELNEKHPSVAVVKIDADKGEKTMEKFGVQSIPTLILCNDGEPVERFLGRTPYPTLESTVREYK